ncbi:HNH endonuclease [Massilia terrae]|uniref:HNH endonuclease n=1 Tax=Massilia terrae TaxID=1811224 RepID=UPI00351D1203
MYFLDRLEQSNAEREKNDRTQVSLVQRISLFRNKVYASRCFPGQLREIIFERDGYRCQSCLRDRGTLAKLGLHLEVDHIKAFVDEGKTTYANGVTLCNQCNLAKHHTKKYFESLNSLNSFG